MHGVEPVSFALYRRDFRAAVENVLPPLTERSAMYS